MTTKPTHTVSISHLKKNPTRYLGRVKAGGSFVVTDHGRAVAVLEPVGWDLDRDETLKALVLAGLATPPSAVLSDAFFETRPRRRH